MKIHQLVKAMNSKKCVVWLSGRHMPASFLSGMPFRTVVNALPEIRFYKPKK